MISNQFVGLCLAAHLSLAVACGGAELAVDEPVVSANLAVVAPGVEVVTDWDSPVFYAADAYWYWDDGVWYRSDLFGGPRVIVRSPPAIIVKIREPRRYIRYRPRSRERVRPMPRAHREPHETRQVPPTDRGPHRDHRDTREQGKARPHR